MHIHSKKASQYFKPLKHYLKALYSNVKHFEILSRVLQLYCNIVVYNQAEIKGDDWTDRKQIIHRTTILHAYPTKQAGVDCYCRRSSDSNPDTNASP